MSVEISTARSCYDCDLRATCLHAAKWNELLRGEPFAPSCTSLCAFAHHVASLCQEFRHPVPKEDV